MKRFGGALLVAVFAAAPASAEMSVGTFVSKGEALKAKGVTAMFSSDLKLLQAEMKKASTVYRARINNDKAAGRPAHSCPPAKGKASLNSDEVMSYFKTLPASTALSAGMASLMKKKYPCA
jgi:hypothetical protein